MASPGRYSGEYGRVTPHSALDPIKEHDCGSDDPDLGHRGASPIIGHTQITPRHTDPHQYHRSLDIPRTPDSAGVQRRSTVSLPAITRSSSLQDDSLRFMLSYSSTHRHRMSRHGSFLDPTTSFLASEDYTSQRYIPAEEEDEGVCAPRIDGAWSWVVMVASMINIMVGAGTAYATPVYLQVWANYFNSTTNEMSLVSTFIGGMNVFTAPLVSALIGVFGFRAVAVAGGLIGAVGFTAASFSPNIPTLVVTYGFVGGVGSSFLFVTSMVGTSVYFDRWRAIAIGIASCGSGIGTMATSLVFRELFHVMHWWDCVRIQAGLFCLGVLSGLLFRPLPGARVREGFKKSLKKSFNLQLFKSCIFWLLIPLAFFATLGYNIPLQFTSSLILERLPNLTHTDAELAVTVFGGANTAGRVIVGIVSFLLPLHPLLLLGGGMLLGGTATLLLHFYKTYPLLLMYSGINGLMFAFDATLCTVIIACVLGPENINGAFGLLCLARGVAQLLGAPIGGVIQNHTHSWEATLYLAGSALALTAILALVAWIISKLSEETDEEDIGPTGDDIEDDRPYYVGSRESLIKRGANSGSIQER